jgi:hypothetical protein
MEQVRIGQMACMEKHAICSGRGRQAQDGLSFLTRPDNLCNNRKNSGILKL